MKSGILKTLFIAGAAFAIAAQQASATLMIDLRVVSVDGVPTAHPKCFIGAANSLLSFEVYAVVTGAAGNAGLEGFQIAVGSILSNTSATGARGNVEAPALFGPFSAAGSTVGALADLDGDGDLDIGGNATASATASFVSARSASMTGGNADGLGASEFKLYTFGFRLASSGDEPLTINWRKTDFTGLTTEYIWLEDGVLTNSRGVNGGSVGQVQVGAPVLSILECRDVPEPSTAGLGLLGALGMAGFRRVGR